MRDSNHKAQPPIPSAETRNTCIVVSIFIDPPIRRPVEQVQTAMEYVPISSQTSQLT